MLCKGTVSMAGLRVLRMEEVDIVEMEFKSANQKKMGEKKWWCTCCCWGTQGSPWVCRDLGDEKQIHSKKSLLYSLSKPLIHSRKGLSATDLLTQTVFAAWQSGAWGTKPMFCDDPCVYILTTPCSPLRREQGVCSSRNWRHGVNLKSGLAWPSIFIECSIVCIYPYEINTRNDPLWNLRMKYAHLFVKIWWAFLSSL